MPLTSHATHFKGFVALAAAAAALVLPSAASAACAPQPKALAFAGFGDPTTYSIVPAGDFEARGWTLLGGARIVEGNESSQLTGGGHALELPRRGIAISPEFCVGSAAPRIRFMAKPRFWYSSSSAFLLYRDASGAVTQTQIASSSDAPFVAGSWQPSAIAQPEPAPRIGGTGDAATVQLLIRQDEGSTQFDSVMVAAG